MTTTRAATVLALCAVALAAAALAVALRAPTPAPAAAARPAPPLAPTPGAQRVLAAAPGSATLSDVAEAAVQSVVNISTTKVTVHRPSRDEQFFRRLWGLGSGDREQETPASLGSGVVVSQDGVVVTNHHVVEGAAAIAVRLADGRELQASLVGADPRSDLAVLRLQGDLSGLRPLPLADSDKVRLGEMVLAIGSPFGLAQSVSLGIVSAKGRADVNIADYEDFIQTDAAINPGNSGGALVNLRGELVGIATAIASNTGGSQGIGFAIPSNMVRPIMHSLLQNGRMVRGWLGVAIQTLTPALARQFEAPVQAGVLIADVHPGSVAERAGLQRGDIAVRVGNSAIGDAQHFRNAIGQAGAGAKVAVELYRQGKKVVVEAVLAEAPTERRAATPSAPLLPGADPAAGPAGLQLAELTPQLRGGFGLPSELQGVAVVAVAEESAAAAAGLRRGDVVLEVDRQPVRTVAEVARLVVTGKPAAFLVWRAGRATFVVVGG